MKRLHVHVHVTELEKAVAFYAGLFGVEPSVKRDDYAKWSLEEPAVNFAISVVDGANGVSRRGISHLGIEAGDEGALGDIRDRFQATGGAMLNEEGVTCCYARGNKSWIQDPAGIPWEAFHTIGTGEQLASDFELALPPEVIAETTSESLKPGGGEICCG